MIDPHRKKKMMTQCTNGRVKRSDPRPRISASFTVQCTDQPRIARSTPISQIRTPGTASRETKATTGLRSVTVSGSHRNEVNKPMRKKARTVKQMIVSVFFFCCASIRGLQYPRPGRICRCHQVLRLSGRVCRATLSANSQRMTALCLKTPEFAFKFPEPQSTTRLIRKIVHLQRPA